MIEIDESNSRLMVYFDCLSQGLLIINEKSAIFVTRC